MTESVSMVALNSTCESLGEASGAASASSSSGRPRLLVVPHVYAEDIRIRDIEFARRLTRRFDVFCLKWKDALHVNASSPFRRRSKQLLQNLRSFAAKDRTEKNGDGITYIQPRILQPVLIHRLAGKKTTSDLVRAFNTRSLEKVIRRNGITYVLLGCGLFRVPRMNGVQVFYDLGDWFPEDQASPAQLQMQRKYLQEASASAAGVFAVSDPLSEMLRAKYNIKAVPLPNGADLNALRSVAPSEVEALRHRWGLEGKFVIGYIGNHDGAYTGVDFVLEVFRGVRQRLPDAALLIVGPAGYWKHSLNAIGSENTIVTGPVAPALIPAYFHLINLGVLAQEKSPGTEFAFQIKMVEYTACRKLVISTPLRVWEELKWPNVALVERDRDQWINAMVKLREARWKPEWDGLTNPYDWQQLADRAADFMLGEHQPLPGVGRSA